jgi:hypothetical protein
MKHKPLLLSFRRNEDIVDGFPSGIYALGMVFSPGNNNPS